MIELDDTGKKLLLSFGEFKIGVYQIKVKVLMVIKAPRGTMALFDYKPHRQWSSPTSKYLSGQRKAIRAFMKEDKNG